MLKTLARCALLAFVMIPATSDAEPIKLKFAYFSSDRTTTYVAAIKPFVDAVNAEAAGLVHIDVSLSGELGKNPAQQLQLVLDGTADLAFVVPGYTPGLFPDNEVIELPGLFRNVREATLVYTGLIEADALRGYNELIVVGAFASEPETIHTRSEVASLQNLKGIRIRSNNAMQATAAEGLGMVPVEMPINQASSAIGGDKLDGAFVGPKPLIEFGISRVVANHYLLAVSSAPLVVVMNRKTFDRLPEQARKTIRRFSGRWTAEEYIKIYQTENNAAIESLNRDPNRKVVIPSPADLARSQAVFKSEVAAWAATDPRHQRLLEQAEAELSKIRAGTVGQQ